MPITPRTARPMPAAPAIARPQPKLTAAPTGNERPNPHADWRRNTSRYGAPPTGPYGAIGHENLLAHPVPGVIVRPPPPLVAATPPTPWGVAAQPPLVYPITPPAAAPAPPPPETGHAWGSYNQWRQAPGNWVPGN
eukprot:7250329-Heterocapsa_arctica.AAC.1